MRLRIKATLIALALAAWMFGSGAVALAANGESGGAIAEENYQAVQSFGDGTFYACEETSSLGAYIDRKFELENGALDAQVAFDIVNSPLFGGGNDAWLCVSLSSSAGVKRPNESPASDVSALLRISEKPAAGKTVNVTEFFADGLNTSGAGAFPFETGVAAVRFSADADAVRLYINGSLVYTYSAHTAADYEGGAYVSFCTYNSSISPELRRHWEIYGSIYGGAHIASGSIDRKTGDGKAVFECYDFGAGIAAVRTDSGAAEFEYDARNKTLAVRDPRAADAETGSKFDYTVTDGSGKEHAVQAEVFDSRAPELISGALTVKENLSGEFGETLLGAKIYGAKVESVTVGNIEIAKENYSVTDGGVLFGAAAFSSSAIRYGDSVGKLVTDKGELEFTLRKTSEKKAEFGSYIADKLEVYRDGGYAIETELYGDAVTGIRNPQNVDASRYFIDGNMLTLKPALFDSLALGERKFTVTLQKADGEEYSAGFTLVVLDTRTPAITAYRNYDLFRPQESAIYEFCAYDYSSVSVSLSGREIYSSQSLKYGETFRMEISPESFDGLSAGEGIEATISGVSRTAQTYEETLLFATVNTSVSDCAYVKDDDELDFRLPYDANGGTVSRVTADGADADYAYSSGMLTVSLASLYYTEGDAAVKIYNDSFGKTYETEFTLSVTETRSARAESYTIEYDKSANRDASVKLELFKHTFGGLYSTAGKLTESQYSFEEGVLTVKRTYLSSLPRGTGKLWAEIDGAKSIVFSVSVAGDSAPQTLSAFVSADLENVHDVVARIDLKEERALKVTVNGEDLKRAYYTVTDSALTLKASYISTLRAGEYVYRIVTAGGTCDYTLTVLDTRVQLLGENIAEYNAADGDFEFTILKYSNVDLTYLLDGKDVTAFVAEEDGIVTVKSGAFDSCDTGPRTLTVRSANGDAVMQIRFTEKPRTDLKPLWYALAVIVPLALVATAFATVILLRRRGKPQIK